MSRQASKSARTKQAKSVKSSGKDVKDLNGQPVSGKGKHPLVQAEEENSDLLDAPFSAIKHVKLTWLWENRLEWASVSIIQGSKGAGKSTWLRAMAADVTGGPPLPGKARKKRVLGAVLWYAGEENLESRVLPGLIAAGADIKRCFGAHAHGEVGNTLALPNDCARLEAKIIARGVKLVVIDPIFAFTDGTHDLEGPTVPARKFMREIQKVAVNTGAAIILSRNITKSTCNGAVASGRGSGEIGNAARSVLHLAPLPGVPEVYVFSVAANNNAAPVPAITYRLEAKKGASVVQMIGTTTLTADELVSGDEGSLDRSLVETAKALIVGMIPNGKLDSKIVKAKAEAAMISTRTLQLAAKALGVRVKREGSRDATVSFWLAPSGGWK